MYVHALECVSVYTCADANECRKNMFDPLELEFLVIYESPDVGARN